MKNGYMAFENENQYTENSVISAPKADCGSGILFFSEPLRCLSFPPKAVGFAEVEALSRSYSFDGVEFRTTKLNVVSKLDIRHLANAQIDFVREHCKSETNSKAGEPAVTGDFGYASAGVCGKAIAGYHGAAVAGDHGVSTAGERSVASAGYSGNAMTGNSGVAISGDHGFSVAGGYGVSQSGVSGISVSGDIGLASSGNEGFAYAGLGGMAAVGDFGIATSRGKASVGANGAALVRCECPKVKGGDGAVLTMVKEESITRKIVDFCTIVVGQNGIKPNIWYTVENGNAVEIKGE